MSGTAGRIPASKWYPPPAGRGSSSWPPAPGELPGMRGGVWLSSGLPAETWASRLAHRGCGLGLGSWPGGDGMAPGPSALGRPADGGHHIDHSESCTRPYPPTHPWHLCFLTSLWVHGGSEPSHAHVSPTGCSVPASTTHVGAPVTAAAPASTSSHGSRPPPTVPTSVSVSAPARTHMPTCSHGLPALTHAHNARVMLTHEMHMHSRSHACSVHTPAHITCVHTCMTHTWHSHAYKCTHVRDTPPHSYSAHTRVLLAHSGNMAPSAT